MNNFDPFTAKCAKTAKKEKALGFPGALRVLCGEQVE